MVSQRSVAADRYAAVPGGRGAGGCYSTRQPDRWSLLHGWRRRTGAWAGQDGAIATYSDGGWRFVTAFEGAQVLDKASGQMLLRRSNAWETGVVRAQEVRINGLNVLRERQPAVSNVAGGSVVDTQCRAAVAGILAALRTHGLIA